MRWTAPMNAPGPPPIMPSRMRRNGRFSVIVLVPALSEAEHAAVGGLVGAGPSEVVEGARRRLDDVPLDEGSAFGRALFAALDAALPLEHRPAGVVVLRQLREDGGEVDLPIAE